MKERLVLVLEAAIQAVARDERLDEHERKRRIDLLE